MKNRFIVLFFFWVFSMLRFLACCVLVTAVIGHGFVEWQTGFDRTVNEQDQFSNAQNYPIDIYASIGFPR